MPRARATEMPQGSSNLRTSSSDSDSLHHRPRTNRSPKLSDGRSPRGSQPSSDPVNQMKLGSRIADLESQLGQAQDELKCLKNQLVSAEAAKKAAPQQQLDKKPKKQPKKVPEPPVEIQEKHSIEIQESDKKENKSSIDDKTSSDVAQKETDVFEVPIENVTVEPGIELDPPAHQEYDLKPVMPVPENPLSGELNLLRTKLDEKDKELEILRQENENMRSQLDEKSLKISSSAESVREELTLRLSKIDQELGNSISSALHMNEKLEAAEKAKEELENEMKRLRVQTEQWRKAANAAANILAEETEMNGRIRISERCGSMDKQHYANAFEPGLIEDAYDGFGGGKRKGSGIRMFVGDLWKKKGHK